MGVALVVTGGSSMMRMGTKDGVGGVVQVGGGREEMGIMSVIMGSKVHVEGELVRCFLG
jgi:hypothetical protein